MYNCITVFIYASVAIFCEKHAFFTVITFQKLNCTSVFMHIQLPYFARSRFCSGNYIPKSVMGLHWSKHVSGTGSVAHCHSCFSCHILLEVCFISVITFQKAYFRIYAYFQQNMATETCSTMHNTYKHRVFLVAIYNLTKIFT